MTMKKAAKAPAMRVGVLRLVHGKDLPLPAYHSDAAAGLDLLAAIDWDEPLTLTPGARALVPTGLVLELPEGFEAQVRPRSGLALKHGVTVLNSPGTIDADYRGEVSVLLANLSGVPFEIRRGERIAQLIVAPVTRVALIEVAEVGQTERGAGGFGSTGRESIPAKGGAGGRSKAKPKKPVTKKAAAAKAQATTTSAKAKPRAKPKKKA